MSKSIHFLLKEYVNNNLRALLKIYQLSLENGFAYYHEIENYLNRERNQVSTILGKLERDNLIIRRKEHRPQKIVMTDLGKTLMKEICAMFP